MSRVFGHSVWEEAPIGFSGPQPPARIAPAPARIGNPMGPAPPGGCDVTGIRRM